MRALLLAVLLLVLVVVAGGYFFVTNFDLSAIPEPGHAEFYVAEKARHLIVAQEVKRNKIPAAPKDRAASVKEGDALYGSECGACHGLDGKTPTDAGRWMYPRAADLTSSGVQSYNDAELFWIIKNGIRLSGMPAFGKVEPDEHIWNLVHFVRTFGPSGTAQQP